MKWITRLPNTEVFTLVVRDVDEGSVVRTRGDKWYLFHSPIKGI